MFKSIKIVFIVILVLIGSFAIYELIRRKVGGYAGSYPFAESWGIKTTIDSVEMSIRELKQKKPYLFLPNDSLMFQKDATGYWNKIDFFYDGHLVRALIRERDKQTRILLVEIVNIETGDLKMINRDFNFLQNRKMVNKFKNSILINLFAEVDYLRLKN